MYHRSLKSLVRKEYFVRFIVSIVLFSITFVFMIKNPFSERLIPGTVKDLSALKLFNDKSGFVTVQVDTLYDTGIDYAVNGKAKARIYYTIYNGENYLFIISNSQIKDDASVLEDITIDASLCANNDVYETVVSTLAKNLDFRQDYVEQVTCPTIISEYSYNHGFSAFYSVFIIVVTIILAMHMIIMFAILINPVLSYMFIPLHRYGSRFALFKQCEKEFRNEPQNFSRHLYMTENFCVSVAHQRVDIIPIENIVWIYNYSEVKHTRRKSQMYNPMCIVTDSKRPYKIPHISASSYKTLVNILQTRYPNIMLGYEK